MTRSTGKYPGTSAGAAELLCNAWRVGVAQVRGVYLGRAGEVQLVTTLADSMLQGRRRFPDCPPAVGDFAVEAFTDTGDGVQMLAATPDIQSSQAYPGTLRALQQVLHREQRHTLVCSRPPGQMACYLYPNGATAPANLTGRSWNFFEAVYLPKPRGIVAREKRGNRLWFLPFESARRGWVEPEYWIVTNALPDTRSIGALPPRIQHSRAVLVATVDERGRPCVDTLNWSNIGNGAVTRVERTVGVRGLAFRGFMGLRIAIVEADPEEQSILEPGTWQVPVAELPELFGPSGTKLAEVAARG